MNELMLGPVSHADDDVTIVIKTFERPDALRASYGALRTYYPRAPVIIIDDSRDAIPNFDPSSLTSYIHTGFDIGLSAGRNLGVSMAATEYTMIMDDDLLFNHLTRLDLMKEAIQTGAFDICGCRMLNFGTDEVIFHGSFEKTGKTLALNIEQVRNHQAGFPAYDFCLNVFLARTSFLKSNPWNADLKLREHEEFFYRLFLASPGRVTIRPEVQVDHYPLRTPFYSRHRTPTESYLKRALEIHDLEKIVQVPSARQRLIRQHRKNGRGLRRLFNKISGRWMR